MTTRFIKPEIGTPRRRVILDDDFSTGLQGWSGLVEAGVNYYPSLHAASLTGPHSMVIDTRGGTAGVTAHAAKRMSAYEGTWNMHYRVAWDGSSPNFLYRAKFILDWQYKEETRWWPELVYTHYSEAASGIVATWHVSQGWNSSTLEGYHEITELAGHQMGYNQAHKYDFQDIGVCFSVDRDSAEWRFIELNGVRFPLKFAMAPETVQTPVEDFDNGSNAVISVLNRPTNSSADPFLLMDYVGAEWEGL